MPPSSILSGSGIIDDGAGTLRGDVTARLLDKSFQEFEYNLSGRDYKSSSISSQGPVTGALSLKATVIDPTNNKGI